MVKPPPSLHLAFLPWGDRQGGGRGGALQKRELWKSQKRTSRRQIFPPKQVGRGWGVEEGSCLCTPTPSHSLVLSLGKTQGSASIPPTPLVFLLMFWCTSPKLSNVRQHFGVFLRGCAVYVRDDLFRMDNLTTRRPLLGCPEIPFFGEAPPLPPPCLSPLGR